MTIVGEPGIGKSRLLEELSSRVAHETGGAVHRGRCLAYGEGIAYWALREILWDAAGVLLDDSGLTAAEQADRARRRAARRPTPDETSPGGVRAGGERRA